MKVGFAERDITPEAGMERPGGYGKAYHTHELHDPCKVRAAVFDDGQNRVALVGVDTLMVPRRLVVSAKEEIQKSCGIEGKSVLIAASHSHSAGPLGMVQPNEFDDASPLIKRLAYELSSCADGVYVDRVRRQIISAVVKANDSRLESRCGVGSGVESQAAFNRRFRMKNGLSYTHPGKGNPDILEAAGPIDPEVGVIGVWDGNGLLKGCIVNYACHTTTAPGGTSADWVYYLEQTIRGVMGSDAVVVFLNGACAEITQVNNLSPYAREFGERSAKYVGHRVGAEAVKVLFSVEPGELVPVASKNKVLRIPRRRPRAKRLRQALQTVHSEPSKSANSTEWTFAKEIVLLDNIISKEPVAEVEVQALQVGPAVFLANPAELFCQYGLDLKARGEFPFTFVVELANGCVGYVPTEEAFGEHEGGYETRLTAYSNLEVGAGNQIVQALIDLSRQLNPGEVPKPPLAGEFKGAWSYGSVPPEID